jgi:hypothetical protein
MADMATSLDVVRRAPMAAAGILVPILEATG